VTSRSWSADDIGDLGGRIALVTGANSGIGYETARALAGHGAHVVLACRNGEKASRAVARLEAELSHPSLEVLDLDLSDLVSVRRAAARFLADHDRLDLLINNAGVMGTPYRQTADGFELQMATNHLGHFALTGLLLDRLLTSESSRVVTVSSLMHRIGHIDVDDVAGLKVGNTWAHYGTSKLANLLFSVELSRRLRMAGESTIAVAAHPGWTRSNLFGTGAAVGEGKVRSRASSAFGSHFGQSATNGAWPSLYAATAPDVASGQFIGPSRVFELFGPPAVVRPGKGARNPVDAAQLWEISEQLTDVRYRLPAPA